MLKAIGDPNRGVSRRNIVLVNDVWSAEARRRGGRNGGGGGGGGGDAPTVALVHALNEPNVLGSSLCAVAQRSAARVHNSRILAQGGGGEGGAAAGRSVYAWQLTSKPREFVCLTARTLRRWVERRPIDAIRERVGRAGIGTVSLPLGGERAAGGDGARNGGAAAALPFWDEIFLRHGPPEVFAMLLALACNEVRDAHVPPFVSELEPLTQDEAMTLRSTSAKALVAFPRDAVSRAALSACGRPYGRVAPRWRRVLSLPPPSCALTPRSPLALSASRTPHRPPRRACRATATRSRRSR